MIEELLVKTEDIQLDRTQTVGHSSLQARGTVEYAGEEYDVTVTDTGERTAVRASSADRVYTANLEQGLDREEPEYSFRKIMEDTELDLAYKSGEQAV